MEGSAEVGALGLWLFWGMEGGAQVRPSWGMEGTSQVGLSWDMGWGDPRWGCPRNGRSIPGKAILGWGGTVQEYPSQGCPGGGGRPWCGLTKDGYDSQMAEE